MILDFRPDLSSHNSWRLLHAFLLFVLGFCALPADLEETACPNVLTGPAAKNDTKWLSFTTTLSDEVAAADQQDKGFDIMWYGDSITETLRGTCIGEPWEKADGTPEVLEQFFGAYRSGVMAVCADQVGHLWWRMLNGELPKNHPPRVAMLLIGTNDLTAADCRRSPNDLMDAARQAVRRIEAVVNVMQASMPETDVVIMGILPRGAELFGEPLIWLWPNRFTTPINQMNSLLREFAATRPRLHYIDCSEPLAGPGGLNREYLRDGIHMTAAGWQRYSMCLQPFVQTLLNQRLSTAASSSGAAAAAPAGTAPQGPSTPNLGAVTPSVGASGSWLPGSVPAILSQAPSGEPEPMTSSGAADTKTLKHVKPR